jgi:hypothetical protein
MFTAAEVVSSPALFLGDPEETGDPHWGFTWFSSVSPGIYLNMQYLKYTTTRTLHIFPKSCNHSVLNNICKWKQEEQKKRTTTFNVQCCKCSVALWRPVCLCVCVYVCLTCSPLAGRTLLFAAHNSFVQCQRIVQNIHHGQSMGTGQYVCNENQKH